ncbi:MAG TPA: ABC transporter permease subunit, partial [Vineibacter sp.]|nr:ABC transporter permease subunit [Vineibacter sp.]
GVLLGAHRMTGDVAEPIFVALYSIPKVTLYPVILLAFGLGIQAKIAFGALHGVIPIVIFSLNAVRQINRTWLRTARSMSLTPMQTVRHVIIPATVPEIFSGLRVGAALTLLGTMLGELFASQRGLGFLLMTAIDLHDVKTIMAIALLITLFSIAMNTVMLMLDRRLHARF